VEDRASGLASVTVRAAKAGDICILLVPSRPPSADVKDLLEGLRRDYGGRIVAPLHVTVDRVAAADTADLVRAIRECVPRLRMAAVRGEGLFVLRSAYRGTNVLKLDVGRDSALDRDVDELRSALRQAGLAPMYGDERSMSVTALERIERPGAPDTAAAALPLDLFIGDTVLVSRIRGVGNYEILDTASLTASG
jgi:phage baseplate assembly protein W